MFGFIFAGGGLMLGTLLFVLLVVISSFRSWCTEQVFESEFIGYQTAHARIRKDFWVVIYTVLFPDMYPIFRRDTYSK